MAKIGIALGSGSAKGWAHIGVFKALADLGIKPDIVAGCSIGAFVGAAYATGNLTKLEDWVNGFSNWDIMSLMDISWRRGGLISGERVFEQAKSMIGDIEIEHLSIPFTAVATDLYAGKEVWLKRGSLQDAVRASCSIPGLLSPKLLDGRYYIDGAVVNPIPVNVCRALGADIVIAVDLYGYPEVLSLPEEPKVSDEKLPLNPEEEGHFKSLIGHSKEVISEIANKFIKNQGTQPNMFAVMNTALEILEYRQKKSRLAGDPPEILLQPRVANIGSMDFNRAPECIEAGYKSVQDIAHLIESELLRAPKIDPGTKP